ncbi:hypothetical protein H0G86_012730 [Trichoderma simmonsii]|uniref:Uncharacterized protein n=1 Tax=Trichoderma simmonsii TaxID=1491479 RepID=A0A8G0LPP3_9HYPO|nr:hypothetical protein H0G86_012730 [Trichoderma simmonsii]
MPNILSQKMDVSAILDHLRPVFRVFSFLGRILIFPLRLASVPLSYLLSALRIVFAPAIYLVAYITGWCRGVFDFVLALQPLYTFLATAAAVGIFAGFTLATSSTVITSYLGMQDSGSTQGPRSRTSQGKKPLSSLSTPTLKDDSSSNEGEWYWPDPSPSRRRVATGLLSQTILEEEDDSDI